jgi:hypothetical protein
MRFPSLVFFCAAAGIFSACSELPHRDAAKAGPFFTPSNVTVSSPLPATMRRVAVLPASGNRQITEESLERISEAVRTELNRTGRFEVVPVSRLDLRRLVGALTIESTQPLPPELLEKIKSMFGADGVLLTDVTSFSAYPPLELGLRMKLADLSDGKIIWASDNIFSAADPAVANSARRHVLKLGTDRGPGDLSHTVLQNPSRFAAYAAAATFEMLPPR